MPVADGRHLVGVLVDVLVDGGNLADVPVYALAGGRHPGAHVEVLVDALDGASHASLWMDFDPPPVGSSDFFGGTRRRR